jgi:serine-type D-Ala-D-Ala carboxypeptidase/endopeptidase
MATGHTAMLAPTANWDLPTLAGAGALRSSANDMLTFLEAFLFASTSKGYKESPLAPAMKAMLEAPRILGKAKSGLGWFIFPSDSREIAMHDGGTGGFCSFAGFDRKERIGVVVLSNAFTGSGVSDIGLHLLNPKVPVANPEPPKERTAIAIDPQLLDNYTGRYRLTPNLIFEITREGDRLFAQGFAQANGEAIGLPKFELFAEGEKTFFAKVADNQIAFETGPDGRATSLMLHKGGRDMPAPRLP